MQSEVLYSVRLRLDHKVPGFFGDRTYQTYKTIRVSAENSLNAGSRARALIEDPTVYNATAIHTERLVEIPFKIGIVSEIFKDNVPTTRFATTHQVSSFTKEEAVSIAIAEHVKEFFDKAHPGMIQQTQVLPII